MEETEEGEGKFTATTHHPVVKVQNGEMVEKASTIYAEANAMLYC